MMKLLQLRAHRPFREIRTKVHSISKLYQAGGQYLDELEVELEGKRVKISKLEEERYTLEAQVEALKVEVESLGAEKRELEQENAKLRNEVFERTGDLSGVQAEIDRFRE